jgi:hypothetical protein
MITTSFELAVQRLLELVNAALRETTPDESLFTDTGETDWIELFELSIEQGVMVLSFKGAMQLPKELQPPLALKLRWIASVEAVEKRYRHQLKTAEELSSLFRENNIRMMLFKGIALSRLYPLPHSREFGDLDIFLCGKAKEGDALLEQISGEKCGSSKKNNNYTFRGLLIENHYSFLYHDYYKRFYNSEVLEKHLLMMLTEAGIIGEKDPVGYCSKGGTLLFPPPEFNALHVTLHLLSHLPSKIVLRHLCDLVVLFKAYKGKIDFSLYRDLLSKAKLLKVTDAIISLSVRYLELNPEDAPPYISNVSLEDRLWKDMFDPKSPVVTGEKRTLRNVLTYNIKMIKSNYWKFLLLYQGKFWKMIIHYIVFRFFNSAKIV